MKTNFETKKGVKFTILRTLVKSHYRVGSTRLNIHKEVGCIEHPKKFGCSTFQCHFDNWHRLKMTDVKTVGFNEHRNRQHKESKGKLTLILKLYKKSGLQSLLISSYSCLIPITCQSFPRCMQKVCLKWFDSPSPFLVTDYIFL